MWRLRHRSRSERGAVAIMVAILSSVLVIVAALSVDLGNAWARGRIVQKQADVSALAAGSLLPMSTNPAKGSSQTLIATRAATYLNTNKAAGQPDATASGLIDGVYANGEIDFQDESGAACSDMCVQLRLTPPAARVDFGLAGAVASGTDVTRSATVRLFSSLPPKQKVIPLWLPSGCGYGPVDGDTEQGPTPSATTSTPTATPTGTGTATSTPSPTPTPSAVVINGGNTGTHTITGSSPRTVTAGGSLTMSAYSITNLPNNVQKASVRLVAPGNTHFIEYAVSTTVPRGTMPIPTFTLGTEVTTVPGEWRAYAIIQENGGDTRPFLYSSNHVTVSVTGSPPPTPTSPTTTSSTTGTPSPTDVPVGCAGQDRGNFGQLFSPRLDANNKAEALAKNLAFGLDHLPIPFDADTYTIEKECAASNGSNPIPGAQLDDISRAGNNCIIGDTGNDGPGLYDAMIGTVDSKPGRLNVSGDATRNTSSKCTSRTNKGIGSYTINNDLLSCFLRNGATLDSIAKPTGVTQTMLDPAVIDSPRFVYLPMVLATDRAQKGYQPIVDYIPAFITDETQTSVATADNGLEVTGNSIKVIRLFAFNKLALPPNAQSPDVDFDPDLGSGNVRLVD